MIYNFQGDMELKRYLMAKTIITIDEAYNQFMKKYHHIINTCLTDPKVIDELSNIVFNHNILEKYNRPSQS